MAHHQDVATTATNQQTAWCGAQCASINHWAAYAYRDPRTTPANVKQVPWDSNSKVGKAWNSGAPTSDPTRSTPDGQYDGWDLAAIQLTDQLQQAMNHAALSFCGSYTSNTDNGPLYRGTLILPAKTY